MLPVVALGMLTGLHVVRRDSASALLQEGAPVQYLHKTQQLTPTTLGAETKHTAMGDVFFGNTKHPAMGEPQPHEVKRGGDMGDEVIDMPIANALHDDGDMHVPAEFVAENNMMFDKQPKPLKSILRSLEKAKVNPKLLSLDKAHRRSTKQTLKAVYAGAPALSDPKMAVAEAAKGRGFAPWHVAHQSKGARNAARHALAVSSGNGHGRLFFPPPYSLIPSPQHTSRTMTSGRDVWV